MIAGNLPVMPSAPHSSVSNVEKLGLQDWNQIVSSAATSDVYYRPGYVKAYESAGHGDAIAIRIAVDEGEFLLPMLLRPLSDLSFGCGVKGYDALSPYGYGGILWHPPGLGSFSGNLSSKVFAVLRDWCRSAGIVSVLLRLHPMLEQERFFAIEVPGIELVHVGPTIALNLSQWDPDRELLGSINKSRRYCLKQARSNLTLTWASEDSRGPLHAVSVFKSLYDGRMAELQASAFYCFPAEYYFSLWSGLGQHFDIAIAWLGDLPVGASIFLAGEEYSHYHLSATNQLGREHEATTLLVNEGARWALQHGCRWLHLGGGKNGRDDLFRFKQSFGGIEFRCSMVRFMADPQRYRELTAMRLAAPHLQSPRRDFFPQYRA